MGANSTQQIEAIMRQTPEVEADTRIDEEEKDPYHAALGPGAADDQPAQQDQQPSKITCKITQPATIQAAVARLVPNPVGYNVNVPTSYLTTQVQPSSSPRPEQDTTHLRGGRGEAADHPQDVNHAREHPPGSREERDLRGEREQRHDASYL
jgi:hypothetical protein